MSAHIKRLRDLVGSELLMLPGVAAVIRDGEGRVLVHQRADDGHWSLPAGALDPGETPADAVAREVHEETGLVVVAERVLGVFGWPRMQHRYPNGDLVEYLVVVFRCAIIGGTLEARDGEATGFRWCTPDELAATPLPYPAALFAPDAELAPVFDPPSAWSVSYADGSANRYRFRATPTGAQVEYEPVAPVHSSSGSYSGGAPRSGTLDAEAVAALWRQIRALEADATLHVADRAKGTGVFVVCDAAGPRTFIIARGPALAAFDAFVTALC